jgi:hypothetical protein
VTGYEVRRIGGVGGRRSTVDFRTAHGYVADNAATIALVVDVPLVMATTLRAEDVTPQAEQPETIET